MLNRRQIRIKALQTLYAHFQSGTTDLAETERFLNQNINRLYDLYIYQLSFLVELVDFAERRIEESKNKFLATEEDLNPNTRFIDNRIIRKLRNNRDYRMKFEGLKMNWGGESELIRKIYHQLTASKFYREFMAKSDDNFNSDREILVKIVRNILIDNDLLIDFFEDKYFLWSEDYYMSLSFVVHTLMDFKEDFQADTTLPGLYKASYDHNGKNEDEQFLHDLVKKTILHSDKYDQIIIKKARNWEFERIAAIDLILLRMGMAEIFEFETIPLKVTLNEIIELAKHFSSPRSNVFINGLLDKTIEEGLREGTIVKKGRGLIGQN